MNTPKPGEKYRHFKGHEYVILCVGKDSETEELKIVYQDLADETKIWIRPINMLFDTKKNDDGTEVQRFTKID